MVCLLVRVHQSLSVCAVLKPSQELSAGDGAAAGICGARNSFLSKSSPLPSMLSFLVGLFPVAQGSLSFCCEFLLGGCVCGGEKSQWFSFSSPAFHHPVNSVNGISIFLPAKPPVCYRLNTSCVLLFNYRWCFNHGLYKWFI